MKKIYNLRGKVWIWPSEKASWHFVGIDKKTSAEIKEKYGKYAKGFRSLPVEVTVGKTTWKTSIFPDSKSSTYLLPLKADVRRKEVIVMDTTLVFSLKIR